MLLGAVTSASLLEALDQMPPARASDMLASILASAADRLAVLNATNPHERLQTVLVLVQQVCVLNLLPLLSSRMLLVVISLLGDACTLHVIRGHVIRGQLRWKLSKVLCMSTFCDRIPWELHSRLKCKLAAIMPSRM